MSSLAKVTSTRFPQPCRTVLRCSIEDVPNAECNVVESTAHCRVGPQASAVCRLQALWNKDLLC